MVTSQNSKLYCIELYLRNLKYIALRIIKQQLYNQEIYSDFFNIKINFAVQYMIRRSLRILSRSTVQFRFLNFYRFSNNEKPPKGFEKFERKAKPSIEKEKEEPKQQEMDSKLEDDLGNQKTKKPQFTFDPKEFDQKIKQEESKQSVNEEEEESNLKHEEDKKKESKKTQKKRPRNIEEFKQYIQKEYQDFNKDPKKKAFLFTLLTMGGLIFASVLLDKDTSITFSVTKHIQYDQDFFLNYFDNDKVAKVIVYRNTGTSKTNITIVMVDGDKKQLILGNTDHFLEVLEKRQLESGRNPESFIPVEFKIGWDYNKVKISQYVWKLMDKGINIIYLGVSVIIGYILFKQVRSTLSQFKKGGGGKDFFGFGKNIVIMSVGKSNVKQFEENVKIRFKDVAGQDEAKLEIQEFVDFLKNPKKYKDIGAKIPRGALLTGPPGTGKTMLAKACAGEAQVPFFFVSGSDFVEMFVGVGASRVRDLFIQAKEKSPSIVFIDEIDAVGRKRESRIGGNDERDNTLNQLLVEMDGFGTDTNLIVLAATNRAELLDPALTRPGRFDRLIDITLPDIDGRKHIFLVHLTPLKLDTKYKKMEYAKRLASLTPGFSGAEIANLCNEAAILAARQNKKFVEQIDFEMASERVMAGLERKTLLSPEERRLVAFHESGHAVVSWFLEGGMPLLKLTIIPRSKGALGYAQYLPNESSLQTKEELMDRICSILGGRCTEELLLNKITTAAQDDLKKAYQVAHAMVAKFGMSENVGYLGLDPGEYQKSFSDETGDIIDQEIKKIIDECMHKTKKMILEKKEQIEAQSIFKYLLARLSKVLLEKETLNLKQLVAVLGKRPFPPKSNYKAYLELSEEDEKKQDTLKMVAKLTT